MSQKPSVLVVDDESGSSTPSASCSGTKGSR